MDTHYLIIPQKNKECIFIASTSENKCPLNNKLNEKHENKYNP